MRISAVSLGVLATPMAMSANAVTTTLPDIARDIGVSVSTATWLATAFGLAMAVNTPLVAALLRRSGVRTTLLASTALVVVGTVLVSLSESMTGLVIGRAAQALGGSGFVTTAITLAGTTRRMGVIAAGSGMCGALGPLAGYLLSEYLSWHAALALSGLSLLAVPYIVRRAPEHRHEEKRAPFDAVGAVLSVALITSLVFLGRFPAPALVCAAVMGVALALWIWRRPDGFVPTAVLRSPLFLIASGVVCTLSTIYFALLYGVPRLLEDPGNWTTADIGTWLLVALLIGSAVSWCLAAYGAHRMSRSAVLTLLLALGVLAPVAAAVSAAPVLLLAAAGAGVFIAASGQATLSVVAGGGVPEPQRTTALGLFTLCYQLGGAFGPAIVAQLLA